MNEGEKRGGSWEQNRRLSQALGLGWGLRLGEWALALARGLGGSLWQGWRALAGRPQAFPSCPCCLARAHRPLPADLPNRTLYSSSVDLVPPSSLRTGVWRRPRGCLATAPTPPLGGMDLSGLLGFVHSCPFREDTTSCSISAGPACSDSLHHHHH